MEFLPVRVKSIRVAITISRPEPKNVEILTLEGKKSKAYNFNFFCWSGVKRKKWRFVVVSGTVWALVGNYKFSLQVFG